MNVFYSGYKNSKVLQCVREGEEIERDFTNY